MFSINLYYTTQIDKRLTQSTIGKNIQIINSHFTHQSPGTKRKFSARRAVPKAFWGYHFLSESWLQCYSNAVSVSRSLPKSSNCWTPWSARSVGRCLSSTKTMTLNLRSLQIRKTPMHQNPKVVPWLRQWVSNSWSLPVYRETSRPLCRDMELLLSRPTSQLYLIRMGSLAILSLTVIRFFHCMFDSSITLRTNIESGVSGKLLSRSFKIAHALLNKTFTSKNNSGGPLTGDSSIKPGDRVALVYPNNDPINFMSAFYGCLQAGVVPVPIEVPLTRRDAGLQQVGFLLGSCGIQYALTSDACLKGENIMIKYFPKKNTNLYNLVICFIHKYLTSKVYTCCKHVIL